MIDPDLWTIGYEKASFADFLATLRKAGVTAVLDVRDLPLSRKPGFSKRALAAGLAEAGIGYHHLRPLGTPPAGREANRTKQWPLFWQIVKAKLATPEAELALQQAAELTAGAKCCLLCFEADPATCHRRLVAETLADRHGFTFQHLRVSPP